MPPGRGAFLQVASDIDTLAGGDLSVIEFEPSRSRSSCLRTPPGWHCARVTLHLPSVFHRRGTGEVLRTRALGTQVEHRPLEHDLCLPTAAMTSESVGIAGQIDTPTGRANTSSKPRHNTGASSSPGGSGL